MSAGVKTHTISTCLTCGWGVDGRDVKDADQAGHLHTTSKAKGAVQHPTTTRTHPTTRCQQEGCHD